MLSRSGQKLTGTLKAADEEAFTLTVTKKVKPEGAKRKIEVEEDLTFPLQRNKIYKIHNQI